MTDYQPRFVPRDRPFEFRTNPAVDVPDGTDLLPGAAPPDPVAQRSRSRRALWISAGAIGVLAAVSIPVTLHLVHRTPEPLHVPKAVAGLTLDTTSDAADTADYLRSAVAAQLNLQQSVGAVYNAAGTAGDQHAVIVVGGTSASGSNTRLVNGLLGLMKDSTDGVDDITGENPGSTGGLMECALTTDLNQADAGEDTEMAVCAFANDGTAGIAMFPNRTIDQAADLMRRIRPALLTK